MVVGVAVTAVGCSHQLCECAKVRGCSHGKCAHAWIHLNTRIYRNKFWLMRYFCWKLTSLTAILVRSINAKASAAMALAAASYSNYSHEYKSRLSLVPVFRHTRTWIGANTCRLKLSYSLRTARLVFETSTVCHVLLSQPGNRRPRTWVA